MKNSLPWILQADSKKGFSCPDFNRHKSRPVPIREGCTKGPKLQSLSCKSRSIPVILGFGGDPKKRVLPRCLDIEKRGVLVLTALVSIGRGSMSTVVPS